MLRRSARSAGISLRNEDADHGVEPETEVEARGHVGRRDVEEAGAEEGTAGEGERKEPSELDEDEGDGDGVVDARVGESDGAEFVGAEGGALAQDDSGYDDWALRESTCDDCAIKESIMQGMRNRLREVRLEVIQARHEIVRLR